MIIALAFVSSFILTCVVTPLVIKIAFIYGLVDDPHKRYHPAHTHTGIIARAGGLALIIGIGIISYTFLGISAKLCIILGAGLLLVIVGLFDDKRDVSPYIRLATNAIAAGCIIYAGVNIPYITNPLTGGVLRLDMYHLPFAEILPYSLIVFSNIAAFIWILWTINIIGWSAGVDGQMPGFVAIAAAVLGLLSLRFVPTDPSVANTAVLAFIVSGAFAGFLVWNFFPQKIMPGYGGKTLAGLMLAVLGILSSAKVGTALLVLGIPMIDAVYTLLRRVQKGKSPVQADRGHLHHMLLDIGWGKRRIAVFYWFITLVLGIIALTVTSQQKVFALLLVAVAFGGFVVWVKFFTQFSKPRDQDNG